MKFKARLGCAKITTASRDSVVCTVTYIPKPRFRSRLSRWPHLVEITWERPIAKQPTCWIQLNWTKNYIFARHHHKHGLRSHELYHTTQTKSLSFQKLYQKCTSDWRRSKVGLTVTATMRWTRDRKAASSNSGRSGGRIFFCKVNFVCRLLFRVRSTPVLQQWHVKDPNHSAKSAGGRLHLNTHTP